MLRVWGTEFLSVLRALQLGPEHPFPRGWPEGNTEPGSSVRPSGQPLRGSAPPCPAHALQGHPGLSPGLVLFLFLCSGARLCSDSAL